ncbi:MAG: tRNA (adenosine(37)-N6)-threonylcarbamoyltransferase complex dimerization subunit type 1 TsaB [Patescibacteria group bacterium]
MILIINTAGSDFSEIILAKTKDKFLIKKIAGHGRQQSEKLLATVDAFSKKNKVKLAQLKAIGVVSGPGSFTALRIGVTAANTLAYALKLPLVGLKLGEFNDSKQLVDKIFRKIVKTKPGRIVSPFYNKEPNIS